MSITLRAIESLTWQHEPYRHTIGEGFFEAELYAEMLAKLPNHGSYRQYGRGYDERYLHKPESGFWKELFDALRAPYAGVGTKVQLLRDNTGYSIGPHTDDPRKTKTFLFYLTDKVLDCGTCLYVPKDRNFSCNAGVHHSFKGFDLVKTVPFVPNGYFGFERTDRSFHGVPPTTVARNVIQLSVYGG